MDNISVLIIDDEKMCVDEVIHGVDWEKFGIHKEHVFGVYSVRQAQNFFRENNVNIVICDVEMPNETGFDFIEWVLEWSRFSIDPMECVMLTCHPEYKYIRKALQLGCIDYILKPMDSDEMEAALNKAISRIKEKYKEYDKNVKIACIDKNSDTYKDVVYAKIIPFIEENLTSVISVDMIAKHVSLNPQYMMRLFKKETGMSILQYISEKRMEMAKAMLIKTDWSIEMITEKVGYFSSAHFGQVFKRVVGVSPGQYRKEHR